MEFQNISHRYLQNVRKRQFEYLFKNLLNYYIALSRKINESIWIECESGR